MSFQLSQQILNLLLLKSGNEKDTGLYHGKMGLVLFFAHFYQQTNNPVFDDIDFATGRHRTMTLVFARERTAEAIREALDNRRTAIYFDEFLIGEEQYLRSIFDNSVEIKDFV